MGELAVKNDTAKIAKEYLKLVGAGAKIKEEDAARFIELCKAYGLNPFKREIYLIPYGNSANIIVGYETYIKRAERSGKLNGWRVWTEGDIEDGTLKACIEIERKDWDKPFYHEVYFTEYKQKTPIWESKPLTMIKKVAIAQGFRLAFPVEVGGMPYIEEEINEPGPEVVRAEIVEDKKWSLEKIKEVATDELKQAAKEKGIKAKELVGLFEKHNGNQEKIINEIKEVK